MKRTRKKPQVAPPQPAPVAITPHALTILQWKDNGALQQQLQAILDSDCFRMAAQTLLVTALPDAKPIQLVPGVSAEAMALADSARYHHRSGFAHFYRALQSLARPTNKAKFGAEWGDLLPED